MHLSYRAMYRGGEHPGQQSGYLPDSRLKPR